jgi:hypothetical protein
MVRMRKSEKQTFVSILLKEPPNFTKAVKLLYREIHLKVS